MRPPEHNLGPEPPAPTPELDPVSYARAALALLLVVAVFGGAVLLTWLYQRSLQAEPRFGAPPQVGPAEFGTVDQRLFALEHRTRDRQQHERERLRSFGWTDADAGIAHLPVEQAMELLLAGGAARGPGDGGAP